VEIGRITVLDQPQQKFVSSYLNQYLGMVVHMCLFIPATVKSINRRITVQARLGKKWDLISKIEKKRLEEWLKW
jgi:hypothetical protein